MAAGSCLPLLAWFVFVSSKGCNLTVDSAEREWESEGVPEGSLGEQG